MRKSRWTDPETPGRVAEFRRAPGPLRRLTGNVHAREIQSSSPDCGVSLPGPTSWPFPRLGVRSGAGFHPSASSFLNGNDNSNYCDNSCTSSIVSLEFLIRMQNTQHRARRGASPARPSRPSAPLRCPRLMPPPWAPPLSPLPRGDSRGSEHLGASFQCPASTVETSVWLFTPSFPCPSAIVPTLTGPSLYLEDSVQTVAKERNPVTEGQR